MRDEGDLLQMKLGL